MRSKLAIAIVFVLLLNLVGCSSPQRVISYEERNTAVWLNLEDPEDCRDIAERVPFGAIISPKLSSEMMKYPSDTIFAVGVCFAAMVSDSELEGLPINEKDSYLYSVYQEAKKGCDELGMQSYFPGGVCYLDQFFYAFGTESQIRSLSLRLDVRLYVIATRQFK